MIEDQSPLPIIVPLTSIKWWLPEIFPEGTAHRNYAVREMAAKTIFVMLYTGAVEGSSRWIRPSQVTLMSDEQAGLATESERRKWSTDSLVNGRIKSTPESWYATNSREPIRDETLRNGLIPLGAVVERKDVATTAAYPRYALGGSFAQLLLALHLGTAGEADIAAWQREHLSAAAMARLTLLKRGAAAGQGAR